MSDQSKAQAKKSEIPMIFIFKSLRDDKISQEESVTEKLTSDGILMNMQE